MHVMAKFFHKDLWKYFRQWLIDVWYACPNQTIHAWTDKHMQKHDMNEECECHKHAKINYIYTRSKTYHTFDFVTENFNGGNLSFNQKKTHRHGADNQVQYEWWRMNETRWIWLVLQESWRKREGKKWREKIGGWRPLY